MSVLVQPRSLVRAIASVPRTPAVTVVALPGNTASVYRRLLLEEARPSLETSSRAIAAADRIVLPGVGSFDSALRHMNAGLSDALNEARLRERPILGICLGMHLMFDGSEEGTLPGLGWMRGKATRLRTDADPAQKIPHFGWDRLHIRRPGTLLRDVPDGACFYSAHSYCLYDANLAGGTATSTYGGGFASVVEDGYLFGTQFHPEKSHGWGGAIFRNFLTV